MSPNIHPFYHHSGKFGVQGPVLALVAGAIAAVPLGLVYSYLIKWIPFIYLNFFITVGYGAAFGVMTMAILKFGKVRNNTVALLTAAAVGCLAWYGSWCGCARALVGSNVPLILTPVQMSRFIDILVKNGSWGIGHSSPEMVTGIPLAIVWLVEGGVILGLTVMLGYGPISHLPFCETHDCWLSQEKKIDKLDAFVRPEHLEAFKSGDISPLDQAVPRVPAAGRFARLTLKYSEQCHDFCALSIENVTITLDKKGNPKESKESLMRNLQVPRSLFDYISGFEHASARVTSRV